jgi:hypothetical protein
MSWRQSTRGILSGRVCALAGPQSGANEKPYEAPLTPIIAITTSIQTAAQIEHSNMMPSK